MKDHYSEELRINDALCNAVGVRDSVRILRRWRIKIIRRCRDLQHCGLNLNYEIDRLKKGK